MAVAPINSFPSFGEIENLNSEDFKFFQDLILDLAGLSLSQNKKDLVKSRLRSYVLGCGFRSYSEYREHLSDLDRNSPEIQNFINLLTTNKTDFFREPDHFSFLTDVLIPDWIKKNKKEIRVWCCATSTGQEPYTIALVLNSFLPSTMSYRILGTDIDTDVLRYARNGVYHISELSAIPERYRGELTVGGSSVNDWFKIKDKVHQNIEFKRHNLVDSSVVANEKFDLIFCRNILIYFSPETIVELQRKLHQSLTDDGTLIIGHAESLKGDTKFFKSVEPSIFNKSLNKNR